MMQAMPDGALYAVSDTFVLLAPDGVTFQEVTPTVPGGLTIKGIHMLNSSCGFAVAASDPTTGTAQSAVLWTGDGGQTWEVRATNVGAALRRLWFVSPNDGWAAGVDGQGHGVIGHSADGGRNWLVGGMPDHSADVGGSPVPVTDCSAVRFFDNLRGVALCTACTGNCDPSSQDPASLLTVLAWTADGAQSWTMDPDYEPLMNAGIFGAMAKYSGMISLAFPDPNSGYIAGQNNLVLRYSAAQPEPAGWGQSSCDPSAGGHGSGGSGAGAQGTGGAGADDSVARSGGCGCALPGDPASDLGRAGWAPMAALVALAAARKRRKR